MSSQHCGFCQADLAALENTTVDARSRGNYKIATLLDVALEKCGVLRENLQVNDREYLKNVSRMAKEQSSSDVCTNLLRDAKRVVETTKGQQQPTPHREGFANMFAASRGVSSTSTPEQTEPESHSRSGFIRMLEESSKNTSSEEGIQRALDEIVADEAKYVTAIERANENIIPRQTGFAAMLEAARPSRAIEKPEPEIRGGYGFRAMLDASSRGNAEMRDLSAHRDSVRSIPWGFVAMLESMSPHRTPATLDEKPIVRRGMGFRAMLEGASRGT